MFRIVVVDDSAFMRHAITRVLRAHPDLEVVGTAADGEEALEVIARLRPDVMTLDVEMPRMDGLQTLARVMRDAPLPVVMVSSVTSEGALATVRALRLGAVEAVPKPAPPAVGLGSLEAHLVRAVRAAAVARVRPTLDAACHAAQPPFILTRRPATGVEAEACPTRKRAHAPSGTNGTVPSDRARAPLAERVVAIGTSTGGPRALFAVLPKLPANLPAAVLIVQHMPPGFTRSLAERLDAASALHVREAVDGDRLVAGVALLAPGGQHMEIDAARRVRLHDGPLVQGVRPSVDVLFGSLPLAFGPNVVAAVLTGMGRDGTAGAAWLREAGGRVLVESEETAVVYGMPRAIAERGLADRQEPLPRIAAALIDLVLGLYPAGDAHSLVLDTRRAASVDGAPVGSFGSRGADRQPNPPPPFPTRRVMWIV